MIRNLFSVKDSVPENFCSRVIYKFTRACCNACYISETSRRFFTRVREHLSSDKSSHIFKHLQSSERCRQSCSADCFEIIDSAPSEFQLKLLKVGVYPNSSGISVKEFKEGILLLNIFLKHHQTVETPQGHSRLATKTTKKTAFRCTPP